MSDVALANSRVSILEAYELIGNPLWGTSKNYCPFGPVTHADGGASPALRVYPDTNSSYCFACAKAWRPVTLLADSRDISIDEAAQVLLESSGYIPESVDDRLEALLAEETPAVDADALAQALSTYCARIHPKWKSLQFDDEVAVPYRECLDLLVLVHSPQDAQKWLEATKRKMALTLERQTS
jgi:hypothetical protein